jgi:hypothetical protein
MEAKKLTAQIPWPQRIERLEEITGDNGIHAFEVAIHVRELLKDKTFIARCDDESDAMVRLAVYAERCGLRLADMRVMIDEFPSEEEWKPGQLLQLRDRAIQAVEKRKRSAAGRSSVGLPSKAHSPSAASLRRGRDLPQLTPSAPSDEPPAEWADGSNLPGASSLEAEIADLRAKLENMKEQKDRWQRRARRLKRYESIVNNLISLFRRKKKPTLDRVREIVLSGEEIPAA